LTTFGDPRGWFILQKHGPLIELMKDKAVRLTTEGRVFAITFLMMRDYLKREDWGKIAEAGNPRNPHNTFMATGMMIAAAAEKWLQDVDAFAKKRFDMLVVPTNLTYREMGQVMWTLIAQEKQHQEKVGWKEN